MHKCRTHNLDYEDFCVLCNAPHHMLHKKLKYFSWLVAALALMAMVFYYSMKLYV